MSITSRNARLYFLSFLKYDFKASISVFFVALPLCLGIALASGVPVYSGLVAGIVGGMAITLISRSELSVSGPAAGLTAICAAAITQLGSPEVFFLSVAIAGILQAMLGIFRLGGFTYFIPSAVIKGMLTAIGVLLISKQIPLLIGYNKPDFWTNELFNILTFDHAFQRIEDLYQNASASVLLIAAVSFGVLWLWQKVLGRKLAFLPASFITVVVGILLALLFREYMPSLQLQPSQFVSIPENVFAQTRLPDLSALFGNAAIWKTAVVICFVATLETLLSIEGIDKLDPYNRITPQNRELIGQGTGNFISGLLGGLPITAVIVRSSANVESGARTRLSAFTHGLWLLLAMVFAIPLLNLIPYCVLAVILIRTGYNLAKPSMIKGVYKQGREQFLPFIITVGAILLTDLLIGVLIGFCYAIYFLIKHTYRAGYSLKKSKEGHIDYYIIELALNVSFLNKKRFRDLLESIPPYSHVIIDGTDSVYIDHDILEIFSEFKAKAHHRHIQLEMYKIPTVEKVEMH